MPANVQELLGAHFRAAISLQRLAHTNTALAAQHVFGFRQGRQRRVNRGAEGLTIPEEVRLTLYGKGAKTQKTETFVAPKVKKLAFLSEDEVGEMNKTLHGDIEDYVNEEIANWTEMCECEEEGDGLDFALHLEYPSWRVRNDGTIDVVIHGNSKKSFDFGWEDEDGRSRTSNALNLLRGNVSYRFFNTDKCNNELPNELAERVVELFK